MRDHQLSAQRDLQIAKKYLKMNYNWLYKIQSHLLFRKYRNLPSTRRLEDKWMQFAYEEQNLDHVNMPINDKKAVFIMRNLCKEYQLQSLVGIPLKKRQRKIKCNICQHQSIKFVYKMSYNGPVQRDIKVGKCCVEMIQSLKRKKRVHITFDGQLFEKESQVTITRTI